LIYEVVWLQLLQLIIGSTAVSIAVLLGTFMGGMCLGSLALWRLIGPARNPLRVYAALELGTAFLGIGVLYGLPEIERFYAGRVAEGFAGILLRGVLCAVCLVPPTVLMGATLPAVSRCVEGRWLGYLYGANIAGGVLGCLAAGFWLLRVFDMEVGTYAAAGINLCVAGIALLAAQDISDLPKADEEAHTQTTPRDLAAYVAIALSGLSALGAEVVWTRLLSLTLGPTVYTFSIILAVFLIGMGIGSGIGASVAGQHARNALGTSQLLLIPAVSWAGYMIANRLPYWDKNLSAQANPWLGFLFDSGCCALALLPATILWGASFPLALAATARRGGDAARTVGSVYGANTTGAIVGAVAFSLVLLPLTGSRNAERALVVAAAAAALAMAGKPRKAMLVAATALLFSWIMPAVPWQLLAFGRRMPLETGRTGNGWKRLYSAEGINSSIAYTEFVDKRRYFHVAGKIEASSTPADMKVQRVLGHLPALLHPDPRSVLIVGCGAGVTAGSFVVHPEVERITVCEIEPLIPPATARFFAKENHDVIHDARTRIVYDDARHFVLTSRGKFDIVTSDPIHPWVKGAATLYSKEYFEACRAHLNPGGLVTQWVPLYESDLATVQSEIATFFDVFPNGIVWGNPGDLNQGYDVVLMGSVDPVRIDLDAVQRRLDRSPRLLASMSEAGFHSAAELLGTYAAQTGDLREWLKYAQINRDRGLRLQYLAGMALNQGRAGEIYAQIVRRGGFPPNVFTGSAGQMEALHKSFDDWRSDPF
jgi:spermidine synthase